MNFCYVILHYKTSEDTINCVQSIISRDSLSSIVIVDNASNNGSIEMVEAKFLGNDKIHIIKNSENLGFASGNNVGYSYAKNELAADFIAVSNNDILIDSDSFADRVMNLYTQYPFHICGPDIESLVDCKHQNPMKTRVFTKKQAQKEVYRYTLLYLLSRLHLYDILKKNKSQTKENKGTDDLYRNRCANVKLHGSFMIFSPDFIKEEEEAFRSGTFLYMEETILFRYCSQKNYKTLYFPEIKVFHKEDSSTNSLFTGNKAKREFVFRNMIKSFKVYLSVLEE